MANVWTLLRQAATPGNWQGTTQSTADLEIAPTLYQIGLYGRQASASGAEGYRFKSCPDALFNLGRHGAIGGVLQQSVCL
jgi:hypothetical protein